MSELDQLTHLIDTCLSNDNEARKRSEALLQNLRDKDINQYIYAFTTLLKATQKSEIKVFCLVHIRRQISDFVESKDGKWHVLHPDTQKFLKETLLDLAQNDTDVPSRQVLNDIIGEVASTIQCLDKDRKAVCTAEGAEWPQLMQTLWALLNTGNPMLMESALKIMGTLFVHCGQLYASYRDELVPIFRQALVHASPTVNVSAMEALSCYTENVEFKSCKAFLDLMPIMLTQTLVVIQQNEDYGVDALGAIMDVLDTEPKMFKTLYKDLVELLKQILKSEVGDGLKQSALETLLIAVERLPKTFAKDKPLIKEIAELIFTYMVTSTEDPDEEWLNPPEGFIESTTDEDSPESVIHFCMSLIDRMIVSLNKKQTLQLLSQLILEMVKSNNWRYQFCALMSLSQCGEHIDDLNEFDPIVNFVVNFLGSEHPKVRYAALHVLGQTAEDCRPLFQKKYAESLLPAMINMFNDKIPRVVYHSLNALTNFLEGCPKEHVLAVALNILEPCLIFLNNGTSILKESTLTTLGSLAEACETNFVPYWEKTAESIFQILNTTKKEWKGLRGNAIEALTLIGSAVGRQEFKKVCHTVIEKMVEIQTTDIDKLDPQNAYLLSSWHRICSTLQEDFIPYLNFVMPSLFVLVEDIIKAEHEKKSDETPQDIENDVVRHTINRNAQNNNKEDDDDDKIFTSTNTSESNEITILAKMMRGFAVELNAGYLPYVEKTSEILVHLLEKSDNEEVRIEAARGLPQLINVINLSNHPNKEQISTKLHHLFLQALWEQLWEEADPETMEKLVEVMKDVITKAGRCMTQDDLNLFNENVLKTLAKSDERKVQNNEYYQQNADDFDDDDEEILEDTNKLEEELHLSLAELIGTLFKVYKEATLPLVQLIYTQILPKALNPEMPIGLNKFGLFLIDDMIEHLGIEMIPEQWPHLSEALLKYATHSNLYVRHAAIYGIGQLGVRSKDTFRGMSDQCMKVLYQALDLQRKGEEDADEFGETKDNIVAALGKIIKSQYSSIDLKHAIGVWLNHLPLKYDLEEGKVQHELLVDIILESDAALIFGQNGENLPRTIKVLAEVVNTKATSEGFKGKVVKVIELLASNDGTKALLQNAIGGLSANLQKKLKEVVEQ